jgi:type I restriction enzyme M protein
MDYWAETMQDDCYLVAADGWKAGAQPREIVKVKNKDGKLVWAEQHDYLKDKRRFKSDLVPAKLLIDRYFVAERDAIEAIEAELSNIEQELETQKEEQGGEDGLLSEANESENDKIKITTKAINARLKEIKGDPEFADEQKALEQHKGLLDKQSETKKLLKEAKEDLDAKIDAKYAALTETEIRTLVVDDKWISALTFDVQGEIDRVAQTLTSRIRHLAERYEKPLPEIVDDVNALADRVDEHLTKMGAEWKRTATS